MNLTWKQYSTPIDRTVTGDHIAEVEAGTYWAMLPWGCGNRHTARFQPKQGRSRFPKDKEVVGNGETLEAVKALCEKHYAAQNQKPSKRKRAA